LDSGLDRNSRPLRLGVSASGSESTGKIQPKKFKFNLNLNKPVPSGPAGAAPADSLRAGARRLAPAAGAGWGVL